MSKPSASSESGTPAPLAVERSAALPFHPVLRGRAVDQPKAGALEGDLIVAGWVVGEDVPVGRVVATADGTRLGHVQADRDRADVAEAHPDLEHAGRSGFRIRLPRPAIGAARHIVIGVELGERDPIPIWEIRIGPAKGEDDEPPTRRPSRISRWARRREEPAGNKPAPDIAPAPALTPASVGDDALRIVAIISAFNEADIIDPVIEHLADEGISSYLIDNGSTDDTAARARERLGRGLLGIETLPPPEGEAGVSWQAILARKLELARELGADWYIHHDADEIREAPWPGVSLNEAIHWVDRLGFNAIDFRVLNFPPVDDAFRSGDDPREHFIRWEDPAEYDRLQHKCWKAGPSEVALEDGGHDVRFDGRRVFPVRFLMRHYPIRSQTHGARKVMRERKGRFHADELALGWHRQYDHVSGPDHLFLRNPASLRPFDLERIRLETTLEDARKAPAEGILPADGGANAEPVPADGSRGFLEKVDPTAIYGWAAREGGGEVLTVEIWDGGRLVASTPADRPRADLQKAGLGAGLGGFAIRTPRELLDGRAHWIWATVAGTAVALDRSPLVLQAAPGSPAVRSETPDPAAVA